MEFDFEFEMEDWVAFQKYYMRSSKVFKRAKLLMTLLIPAIFCVFILIDIYRDNFHFPTLVIYVIGSVFWIVYYPNRFAKRIVNKTKKIMEEGDNSGILGLHKFILNDEGIVHIEPSSEMKMGWGGIKKLEESEDYYFLFNTAVSAFIIPKRKIKVDLNELSKLLKAKIV